MLLFLSVITKLVIPLNYRCKTLTIRPIVRCFTVNTGIPYITRTASVVVANLRMVMIYTMMFISILGIAADGET